MYAVVPFLMFGPKHRLWLRVNRNCLTCTYNQCFIKIGHVFVINFYISPRLNFGYFGQICIVGVSLLFLSEVLSSDKEDCH